nr:retrovirus-related Pol polyprotein from transposon TNT 1-94 [Tanacetum cinerariifolium]
MKQMNKEIKPANYTKINHLSEVFVPQKTLSREKLYFSNNSKTTNVSKSFLIPNEDISDDPTPSVARSSQIFGDFKSLAKEADDSLAKHKALELEIERLLKAVVSQDIMTIVQNESVVDTSDLQTELKRTKERFENCIIKKEIEYAKLWNDCNIYKNAKLRMQLFKKVFEQKDNTLVTSENTKFAKQPIMENLPKVGKTNALSKPVTSNSVSTPQESKGVNNDKVIAPGMFRINPSKISREAKHVPNTNVNGKNSCGKNRKAKVSVKEIQKKYQPKASKTKKVGTRESLATPKPRKSRLLLRWSPTGRLFNQEGKLVDSSETKSKSNGNVKLLINFIWKFMGTVRFGNDHVAAILGFGDLQWGNILITRVYFVEGLGQFYDSDLEVAFRRNACFVRNLAGVDLLKGDRSTNLYTINLHEMASASPICLMARASSTNSWLWHQRLSHLNFDTINDLARNDLNDREDIRKLGAKGDIGFFIGYSADSCAYRVYNRQTKKIMETMNVSLDELSAMDFEQRSSKHGLNCMTSGHISSGLDLTYAPSTITTQQPSKGELDLLFEAMYDDYFGGQPSATMRTVLPAQEPQVRQTSMASTTIADTAPIPTNSSSHATNIPITSQDVDELNPNAMIDGNTFVNPFANSSTNATASSSSQNVDPSNMHTFYQPYPYEFQWIKDHPLEQNVKEAFTRNQLRSDGDMCMYALSVSTMEPKNVKEAMTDPAWIDSMQEEILQFKRLDVWVLVPAPDNISPLTLKWLFKNKHDEE